MAIDVTMPQMGESVVEGTIAKWLVKEGDQVSADQPLVEISTDKVDTEIPSPAAGVISKILVAEGETVPVGARIAELEPVGAATAAGEPATPPPAGQPQSGALEEGGPQASDRAAEDEISNLPEPAEQESRRYSPVVLRMAADYGIDPNRVRGTGLGGRVTKRDLANYLESLGHQPAVEPPPASMRAPAAGSPLPARQPNQPSPSVVRPAAASSALSGPTPQAVRAGAPGFRPPIYEPRDGDTVEPFSRRRKLIAEHMIYSKTHSPHVGTVADADLTRMIALREAHKEGFRRREGFALTLLPMVAAATIRALKEFPRMNASVAGDSLVIRREVNLGIAVDDEEGLLVPVVKSAETMSVTGIAREIERLRRKVAAKQIAADDLADGSFTLSNPGREGNLYGLAIINQPQVGILRMGEIKKRPVVIESGGTEAIAIRSMMYLALSYDHRVIDGVLGNRFLYRVARLLEEADFEL